MRALLILILISLIINTPLDIFLKERKRKNSERMKKILDCINEKISESFKRIINKNEYKNLTLGKIIKINEEFISNEDLNIIHQCRKKIYLTYKKKIFKIKRP